MNGPTKKPNARRVALDLLREWELGKVYLSDLIDDAVTSHRLPARDRGFVQQLLYAVLRNLTLLDHYAGRLATGKLDPKTRRVLRLGLAEALLLDSAPHALVNEAVSMAGWAKGLINAILRRALAEKETLLAERETLPAETRWSLPKFLWKRWVAEFGEGRAGELAAWINDPSAVYVRPNPLHPQPVSAPGDWKLVTGFPDHYQVTGELPKEWLASGQVYAQDPSTALAIRLLDAQPGQTILDACAAPGGKTLAIAIATGNKAQLDATDADPQRAQRLVDNLRRLHVRTANVQVVDWVTQPGDRLYDRILIDAPCSNSGVMRRRVDVRWRLRSGDFAEMAALQSSLLDQLAKRVLPGGKLVYSTCSLDREENEEVVEDFLARHSEFRLIAQGRITPWEHGVDGAFAAALERFLEC